MPKNSVPLEKVLLQMDLTRGLDERARPEVGGDQSKLITTLENLVQDETGAWVKRPGLQYISEDNSEPGTSDEQGVAVNGFTDLITMEEGLGAINSAGEFLHLNEATGKFRKQNKGKLCPARVTGTVVAGTFGTSTSGTGIVTPLASAGNDDYIFLAYASANKLDAGLVQHCSDISIVVHERSSGQTVAKYGIVAPAGVTSETPAVRLALVDRYLHIWYARPGLAIQWAQVARSVAGVWPASQNISLTATATVASTAYPYIWDVSSSSIESAIACGPAGGIIADTAGAFTYSGINALYCVHASAAGVYFAGRDNASGNTFYSAPGTGPILDATSTPPDPSVTPDNRMLGGMDADGRWHFAFQQPVTFGTTATIPSITYYRMATAASVTLTASTAFTGWIGASQIFFGATTDTQSLPFIRLAKGWVDLATPSHVQPKVIVSLSQLTEYQRTRLPGMGGPTLGNYTFVAVQPFCALDPYNTWYVQHDEWDKLSLGSWVNVPVGQAWLQRGGGISVYTINFDNYNGGRVHASNFAGGTELAGGFAARYDGERVTESGFLDFPCVWGEAVAAGALTGSYNYVAVFKRVDASGHITYSRTSEVFSVTLAAENCRIHITPPAVTSKESDIYTVETSVELYRTTSGGTQYHFLAEYDPSTTIDTIQAYRANEYFFVDDVPDATLQANGLLYRQPGTAGTALDRYAPPASTFSCSHKDRLFMVEALGKRVFYSSFYVDSEAPWFNPNFFIQPHGGSGPITGLASMDGRLFIFKRDAIFVVDGDGPPENGGNGSEFSPPTRLSSEFGCINGRSICVTPEGVVYRSNRGIELLTRSLAVKWIGDRVQNTVRSYPGTEGAVLDKDSRVRIFISDSDGSQVPVTGVEVIYDLSSDCWSTSKYWIPTYGAPVTAVASFQRDGERKVALTSPLGQQGVYQLNEDQGYDLTNSVIPWTFETGWVRPTGAQGRHRFHDALILAKRRGAHKLKASLAYDYESYEQSRIWDDTYLKNTLIEVNIQPKITQPVTFRLKVEETTATGFGSDLLGICFVVSPKSGAQQVAEFRKG